MVMALTISRSLLLRRSLLSCNVARYCKSLASEFRVPLFGKLFLECKSRVKIRSINPQNYPDNDVIRVLGEEKSEVHVDGNTVTVHTSAKGKNELEIPFQYELRVNHEVDGDTTVENLENKTIQIHNRHSSIQMRNIKASVVEAVAKKNIHAAKHLQGQVTLRSETGNIMTDRIQGSDVRIECPQGKVSLQAVYCRSLTVVGERTSVHTGTTKGHVSVAVEDEGRVEVGDVNGGLEVRMRAGNVRAHVSKKSLVDVDIAEGDIEISVSPECALLLDLSGHEITVDEELKVEDAESMELPDCRRFTGSLNGEKEVVCRLQTREGKVTVSRKDWFETLEIR